jgi:hypothetical protein
MYALIVLSAACANRKETGTIESHTSQAIQVSDSSAVAQTVVEFLKWYRDHIKQLDQIPLVNQTNQGDTTQHYSVNMPGTQNYLKAFKQSGYVSDQYIQNWQEYFKKSEQAFKAFPQNEGPPQGFDYDFVFNSQDYEEELTQMDKLTIKPLTINSPKSTLLVQFPTGHQLKFWLTKQEDKWVIDQIKNGKE